MERPMRQRRAVRKFTPDTTEEPSSGHILFQGNSGAFSILEENCVQSAKNGLYTVVKHGERIHGAIKFSGSYSQCQAEYKRLADYHASEQTIEESLQEDEHDVHAIVEDMSNQARSTNEDNPFEVDHTLDMEVGSESSADDASSDNDAADESSDADSTSTSSSNESVAANGNTDDENVDDQALVTPAVMRQRMPPSPAHKRKNPFQSVSTSKRNCFVPNCSNAGTNRDASDNMSTRLFSTLEAAFSTLHKRIDRLIHTSNTNGKQLDPYRDQSGEVFPSERMFHGRDLLDVAGKNYGDYARKLMQIIFSSQDLKTKILPPSRRHLARDTLDENDFNFLLETVRIKYRLDKHTFPQFYTGLLRRKLCDFLIDERRRDDRAEERQFGREKRRSRAQLDVDSFS